MKTRSVLIYILLLILTDQGIKVIIYSHFIEYQFEIIPKLLDFNPTFNDKYSYVNSLLSKYFNVNIGLLIHLVLFLFLGGLIFISFFYLRNNISKHKKLLDTVIIFLVAAVVCTLTGNLIWKKGVLDYLYLKPLFVFDLKDMYSDVAIVLFFIYFAKNWTELKPVKTSDIFLYTKNRLKKSDN